MLAGRPGRAASLDDEHTVKFFEQLPGVHAVKVLQRAVVGQNLHLVVGEEDGKKESAVAIRPVRCSSNMS